MHIIQYFPSINGRPYLSHDTRANTLLSLPIFFSQILLLPLPKDMAKPSSNMPTCFIVVLFIISRLISKIGKLRRWTNSLPHEVLSLDIATRLRVDPDAIRTASSDFGKLVQEIPSAVLYPSSINDIVRVVNLSYNSSVPFGIAARGHGHSVRGQAMAPNGIVVEMSSLSDYSSNETKIKVSWSPSLGYYADVGGEQLWIDVLRTTLDHGLAPVSWTDYLYLTVGGTLSNAGISGQTFRYGPQISNVHELDVINGTFAFLVTLI